MLDWPPRPLWGSRVDLALGDANPTYIHHRVDACVPAKLSANFSSRNVSKLRPFWRIIVFVGEMLSTPLFCPSCSSWPDVRGENASRGPEFRKSPRSRKLSWNFVHVLYTILCAEKIRCSSSSSVNDQGIYGLWLIPTELVWKCCTDQNPIGFHYLRANDYSTNASGPVIWSSC